jgi:hypothetical protein
MATAVVASNIADIRGVARDLRNQLNVDPMLMKKFGEDPRAVLQDYGLARDMQRSLLREESLGPPQKGIQCYCATLWSIWTTITTGASSEEN